MQPRVLATIPFISPAVFRVRNPGLLRAFPLVSILLINLILLIGLILQ